VVTEWGSTRLTGRTVRERTKALIGIAHPDFREELTQQAQQLGYL
jgi:acyl-CoA hydrolase